MLRIPKIKKDFLRRMMMRVRSGFVVRLTQRLVRWLGLALVAALMAGCAASMDRGVLNYGVASPEAKQMTWPPMKDTEVPRYLPSERVFSIQAAQPATAA